TSSTDCGVKSRRKVSAVRETVIRDSGKRQSGTGMLGAKTVQRHGTHPFAPIFYGTITADHKFLPDALTLHSPSIQIFHIKVRIEVFRPRDICNLAALRS